MLDQEERLSTIEQWNDFFKINGPWESNNGREQTRLFAQAFCKNTAVAVAEEQTILDCGCALGDALPILSKRFPAAKLHACDFSETAIQRCKTNYGNYANYFLASLEEITGVYDVIYSSNTLEHFSDYKDKARMLLQNCKTLCIMVPYNEKRDGQDLEYDHRFHHVVTFRKHSFDFLLKEGLARNIILPKIFSVPKAWSWSFVNSIKQPLLNVIRFLIGKPISHNKKQILFEIERME